MLKVNIVGIGPGNPELLTGAARNAIENSNILIGDKRMLANFSVEGKAVYPTIKTSEIAEICTQAGDNDQAAVLVSGDVGFFSLAKTISGKLPACEIKRFPGISSLVYFAAKLEMSWDDAKIVSMHGREQNLEAAVAAHRKVFSLTGGDNLAHILCQRLVEHGLGEVEVYVGENLSYPEEKITHGTAAELAAMSFPSLSVMMLLNAEPQMGQAHVHGIADESFMRTKVPMTKQEVRSISMSKLQPKSTDIIFDIGAGTGSCSIELTRLAPLGKVYAFERNPEAIELLGKNRALFGITNMEIVAGEALEGIKSVAAVPNAVFVGGSGGDLCDMLDYIYSKNSACPVVVNAVTIETLAEVAAYYKDKQDYDLEIVNVCIARSRKLGSYNLMFGQNPVYVMTARKKD